MSKPALGTPIDGEGSAPWRLARFLRTWPSRVFLGLYHARFLGEENLPAEGGYIIAGNHVSYLDPMLLWAGTRKPTHFIAKIELFETPVIGWGLEHLWSFPISRASADREAIQRATTLLKHGECVGIFPEGTRQRPGEATDAAVSEPHQGVAFIAMRADAPVVPVGIWGTQFALPRGAWLPRFPHITVCYGEPVCPEDYAELGRKERLAAMTAEIMRRIAAARQVAEKE